MTEPTPTPAPTADPTTVILVAIEGLRGEIRGALQQLQRHETDIGDLKRGHSDLAQRVVVLETTNQVDDTARTRTVSARALLWTAAGVIVAIIFGFTSAYLTLRGHG